MDEAEYPGVRASLEAVLENMRTPLKIDFSTGDAITPKEISYEYKLMFENRSISIFAYNTETILAEKIETILSRSIANTRMRDFYDIRILCDTVTIDYDRLKEAFAATCSNRQSHAVSDNREGIIKQIENDSGLIELWSNYQRKYDYAREYSWYDVISTLKLFLEKL